jgi:hypothetical protein
MPVWGYGYALAMAERHFVAGLAWELRLTELTKLPKLVVESEDQ